MPKEKFRFNRLITIPEHQAVILEINDATLEIATTDGHATMIAASSTHQIYGTAGAVAAGPTLDLPLFAAPDDPQPETKTPPTG